MKLRPYQGAALVAMREHLRCGARSVLFQLPTGGGKTAVSAFMLRGSAARGLPSLFICHRRELIRQASTTFNEIGVEHGVIAAGFPENDALIQIASIDTLKRRLDRVTVPRLVVWDECHHVGAAGWARVFSHFNEAFHVGLSATPARLDGKGLGRYFEQMVQGPTTQELIDDGYLVAPRVFAPSTPDLTGIRTRMGDFQRDAVENLMVDNTVVGNAVEHYKRFANGKRAIVFCVSVRHSEITRASFEASGIPTVHIDGSLSLNERDLRLRAFSEGRATVMTNVDLVGEGFDLPGIEAAILLRPTKSLPLYLQQVGRALRPSEGKSEAIILDHAGNALRQGLPNDNYQWKLTDKKAVTRFGGGGVQVRQCPNCYFVHRPRKECPECNHVYSVDARVVEEKSGELIELQKRQRKQEVGRAKTLQELQHIAKVRGYKPGWAYVRWKHKQRR